MKPSQEIEAIVRRFMVARASGAVDVLRGLVSHAEDVRVIGSDEHEWFRGPRETLGITASHWEHLGLHESELLRVEAFEEGTVGWAAIEERRTLPTGETFIVRLTLVLHLESGAWKVVQSHFSTPVANADVLGVELTRTLSDLVDSIDGTEGLLGISEASGTATLMFTDIVDSTRLSLAMGDVAWREAITSHFDAVRAVVEQEGGSVVKTLGDGGMYAFTSGASALRAAARTQQAVAGVADPPWQFRIGVHTGDVLQADGDYHGATVAKAARVAAAAEGGQILVSSTAAGLVNATEFEFGNPMTVDLKGLDGTHELLPLHWK
jgi:class 3 adenylate cyclase